MRFDELAVGRQATTEHTVTDAMLVAFAGVTGDHDPVHLDEAFAQTTRFGGRIAHGMLAASRRVEKVTEAPATVTSFDAAAIDATVGNTFAAVGSGEVDRRALAALPGNP